MAKQLGMDVKRVCLTPESEVCDLVGSIDPDKMEWADGPVTQAVEEGAICLLLNDFSR